MLTDALLTRITRDISDGLIVLDMHGSIAFVNPAARGLLELPELREEAGYAAVMQEDFRSSNDDFFQFLLNAVYERDKTHVGTIRFTTRGGNVKWFRMTTSFLFGEDGKEKEGVVVQFADETEVHALTQKAKDSAAVFVIMMAAICLWTFLYQLWMMLGMPVSSSAMTLVVEIFGFGVFFLLWKRTSITLCDMGLSARGAGRYILIDTVFTVGAFLLMVAAKLVLLRVNPGMFAKKQLFNFAILNDWSYFIYPITVVVQEFLTRGVIHESIKRIMPGKHADFWAIFASSLFFGALHIHKGLVYMLGAVALLSIFGVIYRKQKTIWGLCIPHFVLGVTLGLLFELA